jgi:hypothetical protein
MENLTARIPAFRPKLPSVEKLIPYLREIDKNRWYSNRGMLVQALERRIATLLGNAGSHLSILPLFSIPTRISAASRCA